MGEPSCQYQYVGGPPIQSQYMGGQLGQPPYMGGQSGQPPYMGEKPGQSPYTGGHLGKPPYMGGKSEQPPYMGGKPRKSPHTRGPLGKPPYMGGQSSFSISSRPRYGPIGAPMPHGYHHYPHNNRQIPFLATLYLPDLSCLTNDPIQHAPFWPSIPAKLSSDIPKFNGKLGEDPNNHVMTFHLCYSSNSFMDESIHLRLFQRTLIGSTTKWYIEQWGCFFKCLSGIYV
jgi:hypothetical protein